MGAPMVENLAKHQSVYAFDSDGQKIQHLRSRGVQPLDVGNAKATIDVLILSLPNGDVASSVLFDNEEHAVLSTLKPGAVVIDTSTAEFAKTIEISNELHNRGFEFIDAPVSGMQARAEDGTLTMMCGGAEETVNRLRAPLSSMANNILYMGSVGSGQLAKLVNQLLFNINAAALAEILPLSAKLGLNPEQMGHIINSGTGRSFASEFFVPRILNNDFSQGYPMAAAYKDLVNAAGISAKNEIPTPVLSAATATYQQALNQGHGSKDKGAMILVFEKLLGTQFRR